MLLTFATDAGVTASLADDRSLAGLALPYEIPGRTSAGCSPCPKAPSASQTTCAG